MSLPDRSATTSSPSESLRFAADDVYTLIQRLFSDAASPDVSIDSIDGKTVQRLLTAAVKLYVAKRQADEDIPPFLEDTVTATDVAITASAMLKAVQLELFELTLWNSYGRA